MTYSGPRHAPESRFEYWRRRLDKAEQAIHCEKLTQWPGERLAKQTLNVEFLSRTGSHYMQRKSISGKSSYPFHRKSHSYGSLPLGGLNVIHLIAHPEAEDDNA